MASFFDATKHWDGMIYIYSACVSLLLSMCSCHVGRRGRIELVEIVVGRVSKVLLTLCNHVMLV